MLVNKRGRVPEFSEEDQELLEDLARQAVRALRNARQYEAEKKVEELDALLAVSREITATLDLDRVMQTVVNASAALIRYDRCAIAIQERGRLRVGAVSGLAEFDRKSPEIQRTEELLQWVFLSGSDVNVTEQEDGTLATDRPETEEKFRALFRDTGLKAFYAVLLRDEEGKLGVLAFECREPIVFDAETRDLLAILVNQATVAVRNAQLYQQVPLVGFWKPLLERRRKLLGMPRRRRLAWAPRRSRSPSSSSSPGGSGSEAPHASSPAASPSSPPASRASCRLSPTARAIAWRQARSSRRSTTRGTGPLSRMPSPPTRLRSGTSPTSAEPATRRALSTPSRASTSSRPGSRWKRSGWKPPGCAPPKPA